MQQLKDIANEFRSGRGRFIWQTLSEFGPYVELLEGYTEKGLLGGDLENWMALDGPGRRAFEAAISEASMDKKPSEIAYDVWSGVKRKWPLAYQVVMQKVLVRSANNLFTSRASLSALWQTPGMGDMGFAEFHGLWMARCNDRLARHMGSADDPGISLWDGTVIHAVTKNMVFTEAAQNAAEALVAYVLAAPLGDWKSEPTKSAQKWVKDAWKHIGRGKKSTPEAAIFSQFGGPLRKAMQTVVILRCKANDDEPPEGDKLESQAANFLAERLALLVNNPG
jgi:hypothetical protein